MVVKPLINQYKLGKYRANFYFSNRAFSALGRLALYLLISILLCSCSSRKTPAPVVNIYGSTPLNERVKNSINGSVYTVKAGETLYSIAWRANSDVRQLVKLNKLAPPYHIYPGQKIFLVAKNKGKVAKVSSNKHSSKKQTKSSTPTRGKPVKNTLASNKKQGYGKDVTKKEIIHNNLQEQSFSQKVRHWQWPVTGKVIEGFSSKVQGNKGLNIAGRRGTKIKAAARGKVVYTGSALRGYGKLVIIKHNEDYLSAYAHNDKILVTEQQQVNAGDIIAKMGDTDTQRVMLHFEVRFRGKSVNPLKYLPKK